VEWTKFNCSERREAGALGSFCRFFAVDGYASVYFHDLAAGCWVRFGLLGSVRCASLRGTVRRRFSFSTRVGGWRAGGSLSGWNGEERNWKGRVIGFLTGTPFGTRTDRCTIGRRILRSISSTLHPFWPCRAYRNTLQQWPLGAVDTVFLSGAQAGSDRRASADSERVWRPNSGPPTTVSREIGIQSAA
jgi:hypothetical protein